MKTLKQSIGIDVAKDSLVCCIGKLDPDGQQIFSKTKSFNNAPDGFDQLLNWVNLSECEDLIFVMEATGVYYENLAYWLDNHNQKLSVLLPNKVKHFAKSLNIKTKTDGIDAQLLSRIGLERGLIHWKMPSKLMREIKFLSREYREAKGKLVVIKNQLHAKEHSYGCPASIEKRLKRQISLLETQLLEIEAELRITVMADSSLYDKIAKLNTIPGISFMTIISILAETNAFVLVENAKQLVSYSGLDIQHNQSGCEFEIDVKNEASVNADRLRIDQVIMNLLSNAVKYSEFKGVVHIKVESNDNGTKCTVTDQGIGIPADLQPYVFDRYFRVHASSQSFSGLGLGLFISSEIVKQHGGNIGVASEEGKGSCFWFVLP